MPCRRHSRFFKAWSKAECYEGAREAYDDYFREVRRLVHPDRRLEYRMGSDWKPLCEFLGVLVPNAPFPRVNDRYTHEEGSKKRVRRLYAGFARNALPWIIGFVAIVWALMFYLL